MAQLVEHFTRNEGVVGSSPIRSSRKYKIIKNLWKYLDFFKNFQRFFILFWRLYKFNCFFKAFCNT